MNVFRKKNGDTVVKRLSPCPKWEKGNPWKNINKKIAEMCIENAQEYLSWQPRVIAASDFMMYFKTGDRVIFEMEHFKRRSALGSMMIAECIEAEGRFISKIIDIVWMICEESFWGLPATKISKSVLPDNELSDLELFSCETGNLLSYALYLFGEEFEKITPVLPDRVRRELKKRIIIPFIECDDFTWMGLGGNAGALWKLSNWTPWCYSNCLSAALIVEEDEDVRRAAVDKTLRGLDIFLSQYREDGGCDEGCGYWSRSAGSVFDCLELLNTVTDGEFDIYNLPIIKNMGEYIGDCYIGNGYFVNFADANVRVIPEAELVYRYGMRVGSDMMRALGKSFIDIYLKDRYDIIVQSPMRFVPAILNYESVKSDVANVAINIWKTYDITQVGMARPSANWFYAVKGGHNNETHNHNDVGNFVLFHKNNPVFVDAGVEKYSGKTFSEQRYELWTMQSDYHNAPRINEVSQGVGEEYRAENFHFGSDGFSCNIENAYPKNAGVRCWKRRLYEKNDSIFICEEAEFEKSSFYEIMFLTPIEPIIKKSKILLGDLKLLYDEEALNADYDIIRLDDDRLNKVWGSLYRIRLMNKYPADKASHMFEIKENGGRK